MGDRIFVLFLGLFLALTSTATAKKKDGALTSSSSVSALEMRLNLLEKKLGQVEKALQERPREVNRFTLPKTVRFCGKTVDLSRPEVRERVEMELMLVLGDRAQVGLWHKRAQRVFPIIESHAKRLGACDDLKYVAVIESGLRPAVTSRASAKGWWQFMGPTGRQYGLKTYKSWDERADLDKATRAGLTYLKTLKESFGTYPLALAAYNTGPGRLRRAMKEQGLSDFWRLDLYREAERYVPRTIAIKLVMSDPERYDFYFDSRAIKDPSRGFVKLRLPTGVDVPVVALARASQIDLRVLRNLNPELGAEHLPRGTDFVLTVPSGKEPQVREWLGKQTAKQRRLAARKAAKKKKARLAAKKKAARKRRAAKRAKAKRARYRTRPGDSLWSIAMRHKVSVGQLRQWNRMNAKSVLRPGQLLIVRKGG